MRLTRKENNNCLTENGLVKCDYKITCDKRTAYQKLGQLEDIEEELGIDLKILFKALKQGYAFTTGFNNRLEKWFYQRIEGIDECYYPIGQKFLKVVFNQNKDFSGCRWIPSFKDYGKTWALTKEELE